MSSITLYYKTYDLKMTFGAMKSYKEYTGRCMWSDVVGMLATFGEAVELGVSRASALTKASKFLSFSDAAYMIWCMHREVKRGTEFEEIQDAMMRSGMLNDEHEPWPKALFFACNSIQSELDQVAEKKPEQDSLPES